MTHAMIDLETFGTKPGCAILSIGAVLFDPCGNSVGDDFYRTIDLASSMMAGFTINPETLQWWKEKEPPAKEALSLKTQPVLEVLTEFAVWCNLHKVEQVWCQGATFDAPILQEAFEMLDLKTPWKYVNVRDTRTIYDICGFDQKSIPRKGTYHNALDDAHHQVACVQASMMKAWMWRVSA